MINEFKPLKYDLAIYTSFYCKNLYKARKNANLSDKQYTTLIQCYLIEQYTNKLITPSSLRSLVPYNIRLINTYISVLVDKGYLIRVDVPTPRKESKGTHKNKYYTLTSEGRIKIEYLNRNMKEDIKRFESTRKWNEVKPKTKDYLAKLGILNKGQSKKG